MFFLPNHAYRYYLTYSLPAFLALVWGGVLAIARRLPSVLSPPLVGTPLLGSMAASTAWVWALDRRGLGQPWLEGTDDLMRRGRFVELSRQALLAAKPGLPRSAVVVFDGVDLWGFEKETGPRLWPGDPSLRVFEARSLRGTPDEIFVEEEPANQAQSHTGGGNRIALDPAATLLFRREGERLERRDLRSALVPVSGSGER